jgi:hypothetical protein
MHISFPADIGREQAAMLVNDAMEDPKNATRLKRWEEEKLRLHPDLFADEIKARKENRSQRFLEICQTEGSEFFSGVTKAHTQVLVGYLDVTFPNWDQNDQTAKFDYFFPAISEKFPQLVTKAGKGRFSYPDGPKVAPELARGAVVRRSKPKASPVAAIARGVFLGVVLLAAIYGGKTFYERFARKAPQAAAEIPPPPPEIDGSTYASLPGIPEEPPAATETTKVAVSPTQAIAATTANPAPAPTEPAATTPAEPATTNPRPLTASDPTMAKTAGNSPLPPGTSLFDSGPPAAIPPPPPDPNELAPGSAPAPIAAVTPQKAVVRITKATTVSLKFGTSTLNAGIVVPFVSADATTVRVRFGPDIIAIPLGNTDYKSSGPQ